MSAQAHRTQTQGSDKRSRILCHRLPVIVPVRRAAGEAMTARIGHNDIKVALPFPRDLAPAQAIITKAMQQYQRRFLSRPGAVIMNTDVSQLEITFGPV